MLSWRTFNETLMFLFSRDLANTILWKCSRPAASHLFFNMCISLSQNILFCMKMCKYATYCSILGWLSKVVSRQTHWWLIYMCNPDAVGPAIIRTLFFAPIWHIYCRLLIAILLFSFSFFPAVSWDALMMAITFSAIFNLSLLTQGKTLRFSSQLHIPPDSIMRLFKVG